MINHLESLSASIRMKSVWKVFRRMEVRHSKEDIFGDCSFFFFLQRTCALFSQFPISASFFLLSEVSIQNEHIFAKCGCRTVKKWTGAHQCLPLCGQKEHTCEGLWGKVAQRWKTQVEWRNWQDWEEYQAVVLTIVIVEHYNGNYKSETAQEEKRP